MRDWEELLIGSCCESITIKNQIERYFSDSSSKKELNIEKLYQYIQKQQAKSPLSIITSNVFLSLFVPNFNSDFLKVLSYVWYYRNAYRTITYVGWRESCDAPFKTYIQTYAKYLQTTHFFLFDSLSKSSSISNKEKQEFIRKIEGKSHSWEWFFIKELPLFLEVI